MCRPRPACIFGQSDPLVEKTLRQPGRGILTEVKFGT